MGIDLETAKPREIYNLLIGLVAPRPIALITSMDEAKNLNAASVPTTTSAQILPSLALE